jgi:hypothetical protein
MVMRPPADLEELSFVALAVKPESATSSFFFK